MASSTAIKVSISLRHGRFEVFQTRKNIAIAEDFRIAYINVVSMNVVIEMKLYIFFFSDYS